MGGTKEDKREKCKVNPQKPGCCANSDCGEQLRGEGAIEGRMDGAETTAEDEALIRGLEVGGL